MTDCSSKHDKKIARYMLTAARVAAIGLMITAGARAAHAENVTLPSMPGNVVVDEEGNEPFLLGHGFGTQNYVCAPSATSATGVAFSLFTPQATLFNDDNDNKQLITHFFSPNSDPTVDPPEAGTIRVTWEDSRDSSRVWAMRLQQSTEAPFVSADAVAWLKLQTVGVAAGPTGGGRLTNVTFIQRVNTAGGLAPKTDCTSLVDLGHRAFVPYSADYIFYRKSHIN
jgi:hypothetical protein